MLRKRNLKFFKLASGAALCNYAVLLVSQSRGAYNPVLGNEYISACSNETNPTEQCFHLLLLKLVSRRIMIFMCLGNPAHPHPVSAG